MKKLLMYVIFFIVFLVPFWVDAASITSVSMGSIAEQETGSSFYVPIYVKFSGIDKNISNTSGIYTIALSLDFDDSTIVVTDILSDFYDSVIYKKDGQYILLSIADEDSTGNKCSDQFLACSNYEVKVQFYVKDDAKESTEVKINAVAAVTFKVDPTLENYDEEHMETLEYHNAVARTISIKKNEKDVVEQPAQSIVVEGEVPEIKNKDIEKVVEEKKNSSQTKSSNASLASLTIENYAIDFKKDQFHYDITIDNNVQSLSISAEPEDSNATYQIIGASELKDKVQIVVKAEDGSELTYTIALQRADAIENLDKEKDTLHKINHGVLYIASGLGVIIVICLLISHHNNRKLDKMLKKL